MRPWGGVDDPCVDWRTRFCSGRVALGETSFHAGICFRKINLAGTDWLTDLLQE